MAGETRGELAEAIGKVALERAVSLLGRKDQIFCQKSPDGAVIKPDITIGKDEKSPEVLVLVNASESPRNSDIKYWRNIGEIFDSKARLSPAPSILNLVFRSEIKPELIRLTAEVSDASCLVDRHPDYGAGISQWLDRNHALAPQKREARAELVEKSTTPGESKYDSNFAKAMKTFTKDLSTLLFKRKTALNPLWRLCRDDYLARSGASIRPARVTMLRRGLARWLVVDPSIRELVLLSHLKSGRVKLSPAPDYTVSLGMVREVVGAYEIPEGNDSESNMTDTTSRDLRLAAEFFQKAAKGDAKKAAQAIDDALANAPVEMQKTAELIRLMPTQVKHWHTFVLGKWTTLLKPQECYRLLMECAADPTMGGQVAGTTDSRVWLWDHLVAMIRTAEERNNDFGYSAMIAYFKPRRNEKDLEQLFKRVIGSLKGRDLKTAQRWVEKTLPSAAEPGRRGFQEWLAGKKAVSPVIVAAFAYGLSGLISSVDNPYKLDVKDILQSHAYNLWNKLLTHQDFEPLPTLIDAACGIKVKRVNASSIMGELAGKTVQDAGTMPVFAFKGGLIFWQSVTQAGRDHKKKELSGRVRALKYTKNGGTFARRNSANRMLVVLDGEWRDQDLKVLYESGWDEIFYPDEMNLLVKAI